MIEKYKSDKKFRSKVGLMGYGIFALLVLLYISSNRTAINLPKNEIVNDNVVHNQDNIVLFEKYNYDIQASINEDNYTFSGYYKDNTLTINKEHDNEKIEYVYDNSNYYIKETNEIVGETDVYNPLKYEYLNIDKINEYLNKSVYENNKYKVDLKNIINNSDIEGYILIDYYNNSNIINIEIDYTELFHYFNNDIDNYKVTLRYNKIID